MKSTFPPIRTIIFGFGNSLRGDDGVGPHLADLVDSLDWPGVLSRSVHQLTPELAADLSTVDRVVFIDARTKHLGETRETVQVERIVCSTHQTSLTHSCAPASLLALAETLYGRAPEAWLVSITGQCFEPGDRLSTTVLATLPLAIEAIRTLLHATAAAPAFGGKHA